MIDSNLLLKRPILNPENNELRREFRHICLVLLPYTHETQDVQNLGFYDFASSSNNLILFSSYIKIKKE
jgi:hypothetical protein